MTLDLIVIGVVLLFALAGALRGFLWQLIQLLAVVVGVVAAKALGAALGGPVSRASGLPPTLGVVVASALVFGAVYLALSVVARLVRRRFKHTVAGAVDRSLGALVGASKGALLAWLALSALVFFDQPGAHAGSLVYRPVGSDAASVARRYNALQLLHPGLFARMHKLAALVTDPERAARRLADDPELRELAADPRLALVSQTPGLRDAFRRGDFFRLVRDPHVRELVADPALSHRPVELAPAKPALKKAGARATIETP